MAYCLKCGKTTESVDFYCTDCQELSEADLKQEMEQKVKGAKKGQKKEQQPFGSLPIPLPAAWLKDAGKKKVLVILVPVLTLTLGLALAGLYFLHTPAGEPESADARIVIVPAEHGSIQEAIDAVSGGEIIQVEPGIYQENINFSGKEIVLRSTDPDDDDAVASTVIDGGENGPAVTFEQGEGSGAVLQGFTITGKSGAPVIYEYLYGDKDRGVEGCGGGAILITGGSSPLVEKNIITGIDLQNGTCGKNSVGAGIFIYDSSPTIAENAIVGNMAHRGGGVYVFDAKPVLSGNHISSNRASWEGGGIYVREQAPATVEGNRLENNVAEIGGGIYISGAAAYIRYNELAGNKASYMGGGLFMERGTPATVSGNLFSGNHGGECGGGLAVQESAPRIAGNTFRENSAGWRGGGGAYIFAGSNPRLINNTWTGNTAEEGAAIWVSSDSSPDFASEAKEGKSGPDEADVFFQQ